MLLYIGQYYFLVQAVNSLHLNCAFLAPLCFSKALCNSLTFTPSHTNMCLPCKALPNPMEAIQGSVFCTRTQQQTRRDWDLNRQIFSHWASFFTSWSTVAISKHMIHRLTGHQTISFDNPSKWISQQQKQLKGFFCCSFMTAGIDSCSHDIIFTWLLNLFTLLTLPLEGHSQCSGLFLQSLWGKYISLLAAKGGLFM